MERKEIEELLPCSNTILGVLAADATLSFSVDAECPHCKEEVDIARDDPDTIVASAIFRNAWGDLKGYEVDCPNCGKQFVIDKVEY